MERSEGDRARRESRSCFQKKDPSARMSLRLNGERGIRTLDTGLTPYNGLANRRLQPLGHLSNNEERNLDPATCAINGAALAAHAKHDDNALRPNSFDSRPEPWFHFSTRSSYSVGPRD